MTKPPSGMTDEDALAHIAAYPPPSARHANISSASAGPRNSLPEFRRYGANADALARVQWVRPAYFKNNLVSTDGLADGFHSVLLVVNAAGSSVPLLIQRCGWLPLSRLSNTTPLPTGEDRAGRRMVFQYSVDNLPYDARILKLSDRDRKKIVAAILSAMMGSLPSAGYGMWSQR